MPLTGGAGRSATPSGARGWLWLFFCFWFASLEDQPVTLTGPITRGLHGDNWYAEDGEIIVALVNNEEATVKRFYLKKNHMELRPENRGYKTMKYRFGGVMIQGKVIGVQRGPDQFG